jgi:glucose/arabinose dehydrogenase
VGQRHSRTTTAWWCSLLLGAAGMAAPAAARAPAESAPAFQQITLAKGSAEVGEPMSMTILPDRSVLHTARDGTIRRTDAAGNTRVAGKLSVYTHDEEGLQGIAADPDFATNRSVYVYYAPRLATPDGDAPTEGSAADFAAWEGVNRLSRFTLSAADTIDPASEVPILNIPSDRGICCHVGGDLDFDAAGNLYLSTGDDTNPFRSDGYTPIDERAGRNPAFDAQRSAGNTNDLRGKLLRITVHDDGSYGVPPGNLFAPGTPGTRPEIYAMGFRNPFRFSVDKRTGVVYLGDHGPDAAAANPARGPGGEVEFDRITGPGNYGWPYCIGGNEPYRWYDFDSGESGEEFDCDRPVNESPNNTGMIELPPAIPAWLPYDGGSVPELGPGGSESPVGGPVYHYDPALVSDVKFPKTYDGHFFPAEFGRRWIKDITMRADGTITIKPFPWSGTQVMDLDFGPDGALYVLDYGTGFGNGDAKSALYRIDYVSGGRAPVAVAAATPTSGAAPLTVRFSSAGSADPDGDRLSYAWDFDGNGTADSTAANPVHTYAAKGTFAAQLRVRDGHRRASTAVVTVTVGNTAPKVRLLAPTDGQVFAFGEEVRFEVAVSDPEDGPIPCSRIRVDHLLGHDSHAHLISSARGCSGGIRTVADGDHGAGANLFGVWTASYTDSGGLTGTDQHITEPATRQAEHYGAQHGVRPIPHATAYGGHTVGEIHNGDWVAFQPYDLREVTSFVARVSSAGSGGTLELRLDSPRGALLGSARVPVTGSWETFTEVAGPVAGRPGTHTLYLRFVGGKGTLFDVDEFTLLRGG